MSETPSQKIARPLSPHLQVYKPQMTSVTSILHRATGVALTAGLLMFAWWLVAAAIGPGPYDVFMNFAGSPLGKLLLFGFTLAFYYHLANGIRHLIWDTGLLFKIENAYRAGYIVLLFTAILTALTWFCAYNTMAPNLGSPEECRKYTLSYDEGGKFYQRCLREGACALPNVNCARSPLTGRPMNITPGEMP